MKNGCLRVMPLCKHSVRFHNFNPNGDFHYPFGQFNNVVPITDYFNWRRDNKVDSMTFGRVFSDVIDPIENRRLYPQNLNRFVGYHIDAVKFFEYLKSKYSHKIGYMMDTASVFRQMMVFVCCIWSLVDL